jgi:hypothetical protein
VTAHWVPKMLTEEHESKRMAISLENPCCCQDEGELFMETSLWDMKHKFIRIKIRGPKHIKKHTTLHIPGKGTLS